MQVQFTAVDREVRGPALVERSVGVVERRGQRAVVLVRIEQSVPVGVLAKQDLGSDPANQQQFVQRFQLGVRALIRRRECLIVFTLGTLLALIVVVVDPVENGFRDLQRHPRNAHQRIGQFFGIFIC